MVPEWVLLVDDEPELRVSLREALESDGYSVEEADSAEMALGMIERQHYPVIITDLNMPAGKSGLDLIEMVRARDPKTLCIVITGFATLRVSIEALKRGAYDFLQKPFKLEELEAVIDRALELSRLQKQVEAYQGELESRVLARVSELNSFQEDVLRLNRLLCEALGVTEETALVRPFLDCLKARFSPDGLVMFLPGPSGTWRVVHQEGPRPWTASPDLPPAENFTEVLGWGEESGYGDGYLVPLRHTGRTLGALFLGFESRSSFVLEDSFFELWCDQIIAALYGFQCLQAHAASMVAKKG
ncbi:MAG: response regulator [Holophaga sp.]|nr:response regulator [Holophaga sp.]